MFKVKVKVKVHVKVKVKCYSHLPIEQFIILAYGSRLQWVKLDKSYRGHIDRFHIKNVNIWIR